MNARKNSRLSRKKRLRGIGMFLLMMAILSLIWWAGYGVLPPISRLLGIEPGNWPVGLGHFFLTLFGFGFLAYFSGRIMRHRQPDIFTIIADAFQKIGQGDYSVQVNLREDQQGHPLDHLATNFNTMVESLREFEAMRQDFISTVSHELQSPLTSITGFAQALQGDGLDAATRQRYLGIIEQQSKRLSRLSDSLLSLSSLESRGLSAEFQHFSLDEQIRTVILAAEPQWNKPGLVLDIDLQNIEIDADQSALERVWINLLHNAIKFSPNGGAISIRLSVEADQACIDFVDTGIGMSPDQFRRVFERFFKADPARSHSDRSSGSGLGLAIAKKIVELHGGSFEASSPGLGQGSRFRVKLTAAKHA